MEYQYANTYDV